MTFQEIAAGFKQLPIDERLLLLEEMMRSLRIELAEARSPGSGDAPKLWRGMLKPTGPMPTDQEVENAYVDYLVEKYL